MDPPHAHGRASVGRLARTYLHQYSANTGSRMEDLRAMYEKDGWRAKVREICAVSLT